MCFRGRAHPHSLTYADYHIGSDNRFVNYFLGLALHPQRASPNPNALSDAEMIWLGCFQTSSLPAPDEVLVSILRDAPPVPGELLAAWLLGRRFRIARPKSYPKG
jgi:hypothetical protein